MQLQIVLGETIDGSYRPCACIHGIGQYRLALYFEAQLTQANGSPQAVACVCHSSKTLAPMKASYQMYCTSHDEVLKDGMGVPKP